VQTYASLVCVYAPPNWIIIVLLLSPYTFECCRYVFVVLKASEIRNISQNKHVLQVISRTVQQYDEVQGPEQVNSAQYAFCFSYRKLSDGRHLAYASLVFEYARPSREENTLADAFRVRSILLQDNPVAGKRPASTVFVGRRGDLRFARGTHRTPCFDESKCSQALQRHAGVYAYGRPALRRGPMWTYAFRSQVWDSGHSSDWAYASRSDITSGHTVS
jgi:hypothetical protein